MSKHAFIVTIFALIGFSTAQAGDVWSYRLNTGNPNIESKLAVASGLPYASVKLVASKANSLSFIAKPTAPDSKEKVSLVWRHIW